MVRFYLVPVEATLSGGRAPRYFAYRGDPDAPALVPSNWQARDYGNEPLMLVAADTTDPDDALLALQPDTLKFADDLDTPVGARLATMTAALESMNLPAQMLSASTTDRQVIRGIMAIFAVAQCMQGKNFNIFAPGITLSTTLATIPVPARQALQDCAAFLGYDQTGITLASTVRQVLTKLVQQAAPSPMLGVTV